MFYSYEKVLIIDDDPQFTDIISFQLKQEGFEIDIAHSRDSAIQYLEKYKYTLIVQDVFFPNKADGLMFLEEIKQYPASKDIPVILITSLPLDLFEQEENVDHYLSKAKMLVSKNDDVKQIVAQINEVAKEQSQPSES